MINHKFISHKYKLKKIITFSIAMLSFSKEALTMWMQCNVHLYKFSNILLTNNAIIHILMKNKKKIAPKI